MTVWLHLLDRIMGPSIREAYLRGFADGEARRGVKPNPAAGNAVVNSKPQDAEAAYSMAYDALIEAERRLKRANAALADPALERSPLELGTAIAEKVDAERALAMAKSDEWAAASELP